MGTERDGGGDANVAKNHGHGQKENDRRSLLNGTEGGGATHAMGTERGGGAKNRGQKENGKGPAKNPGNERQKGESRGRLVRKPKFGEGHAATPEIFKGMKIILLDSDDDITNEIVERGGMIVSTPEFDQATHICTGGGQKLVTKDWLRKCWEHGMVFAQNKVIDDGPHTFRVDEDDRVHKNHQLFMCKADLSSPVTLDEYAHKRKKSLQYTIVIPGSDRKISLRTNLQLRILVSRAYTLIRCLHEIGFSLCGQFTTKSFFIDEAKKEKNIRFSYLLKETLKSSEPANVKLDIERFKEMIRQEVFQCDIVPHDLNVWLSLLGQPEFEDLVPQHVSIMGDLTASEKLMSWYETMKMIRGTKSKVFKEILCNLKGYNDWKKVIRGEDGNSLLLDTLKFGDIHQVYYPDDVCGLLKLVRNCRQHEGKDYFRIFIAVVSQNFPNLASDLQIELFKKSLL